MSELTVETLETAQGYDFVRSDGEGFFLVWVDSDDAVVYRGNRGEPPLIGTVGLDLNVADKLAAARDWILAFPQSYTKTHCA